MIHRLRSDHVSVGLDDRVGHLCDCTFNWDGLQFSPLHTAPWVNAPDAEFPDNSPPVERLLSGDFLCAPFAESDIEPAPPHGWTANSAWFLVAEGDRTSTFALGRKVMGARVEKTLTCAMDAPLLYQKHRFIGGRGAVPVAHHVMTRMAAGGRVFHSPKLVALSPKSAVDPGLNHLACPEEARQLCSFPTRTGGIADLTRFPLADQHEDIVGLVERPGAEIGWTAVMRKAEDDILFVLKRPTELPVTLHWYSHGARMDPPWNGRHRGVLGIEDAASGIHSGHSAALAPNRVNALGWPSALKLGGTATLHHVIGAIPRPSNWHSVDRITKTGDVLQIACGDDALELPFDRGFWHRDGDTEAAPSQHPSPEGDYPV